MTTIPQGAPRPFPAARLQLGVFKSILVTLPYFLFTALIMLGGLDASSDPLRALSQLLSWGALNTCFFLMLRSGKTDRYRAIIFVSASLLFIVSFATNIFDYRGSNVLTDENVIAGETPFCHIVIPMTILPAIFTGTIPFPGHMLGIYGISSMLVLWMGSTIILGRGFCSWMCFYGGLDEGFSRIIKRPVIKKIDRRWIYLPFAVLLGIVLVSAVTLSPTYCEWLCPFKAVTEYGAVTNTLALVQTIIFLALFVGLVIVLPLLTRKRTQCGLFCPFGAMQSLSNPVNVYDVRIDPEKCSGCKLCVNNCPTFSLDENSLKTGKPLITCTKCGKCIDGCPKGAISYHIKGTRPGNRPLLDRALFLYPAMILMALLCGGIMADGLFRIFKLVVTGSMV